MDVEILLSGFPFPACSVECDARAADSSKYGVAAVAIGACSLFLFFSGESAHFFLLVTPPLAAPELHPMVQEKSKNDDINTEYIFVLDCSGLCSLLFFSLLGERCSLSCCCSFFFLPSVLSSSFFLFLCTLLPSYLSLHAKRRKTGSMRGQRIQESIRAMKLFLTSMSEGVFFNIIWSRPSPSPSPPLVPVLPPSETTRQEEKSRHRDLIH